MAMAREAVEAGVTDVICTPHLREPGARAAGEAQAVLENLRGELRERGLPLELHLGYELSFSLVNEVGPADLGDFALGVGSHHLLLEMPHDHWPALAEQTVQRVRENGWVPVLAHPERNPRVQRDRRQLDRLLQSGAHAQGTMASLIGLFGRSSQKCLLRQLAEGQVALLASDAHYRRRATWNLAEGAAGLSAQLPGIDIEMLTSKNPRAILEGRDIASLPPDRRGRPISRLGRLRRHWS
jgi:protein-tyrosine phosphatase